MYKTKLKIADLVIGFRSRFPVEILDKELSFRYKNFIYRGNKKPEINLDVKLVKRLPKMKNGAKKIFSTKHPQSEAINWALFKNNGHFILRDYIARKQQTFFLNHQFNKATAYLLRGKNEKFIWQLDEIIYDALQIILIHYLSRRNGFFVHSLGIKDQRGRGLLFAGKSGQGKSTLARIWHKHSRDQILNDDRIIVRKIRNVFFIYGTPWHGDFADYLVSKTEKARLDKLFFIFHSKNNNFSVVNNKIDEFIYPCLFFPFWDRRGLEKTIGLCEKLLKKIRCFRLGFKNTKKIIKFTKDLERRRDEKSKV